MTIAGIWHVNKQTDLISAAAFQLGTYEEGRGSHLHSDRGQGTPGLTARSPYLRPLNLTPKTGEQPMVLKSLSKRKDNDRQLDGPEGTTLSASMCLKSQIQRGKAAAWA